MRAVNGITLTEAEFVRVIKGDQVQFRKAMVIPVNCKYERKDDNFCYMTHMESTLRVAHKHRSGDILFVREPYTLVRAYPNAHSNSADFYHWTTLYKYGNNHDATFSKTKVTHTENSRLWIKIESVKIQKIHSASDRDIVVEGFEDINDFISEWNAKNKRGAMTYEINPWTVVYGLSIHKFREEGVNADY